MLNTNPDPDPDPDPNTPVLCAYPWDNGAPIGEQEQGDGRREGYLHRAQTKLKSH